MLIFINKSKGHVCNALVFVDVVGKNLDVGQVIFYNDLLHWVDSFSLNSVLKLQLVYRPLLFSNLTLCKDKYPFDRSAFLREQIALVSAFAVFWVLKVRLNFFLDLFKLVVCVVRVHVDLSTNQRLKLQVVVLSAVSELAIHYDPIVVPSPVGAVATHANERDSVRNILDALVLTLLEAVAQVLVEAVVI